MSKGKAKSKHKPSAEEIKKAKEEAAAKAKKALDNDQEWVDNVTKDMTDDEKDALFRYASRKCKDTSMKDGKIVLGCPLSGKLSYCVNADSFDCPNGRVDGGTGCKLSPDVSKALKDAGTCIDGSFVSREEGGSYLSPYVPWGPVSGRTKDGKPVLTTGNSSGVTIGTGVDLGAVDDPDDYLSQLEKMGVSKETREKLKPLLGKKRDQACKSLREAKGSGQLVFPQSDVELIDAYAMKSRVPNLKASFNKAEQRRMAPYQKLIKAEKKKKKPEQARIDQWQAKIDSAKKFDDLKCSDQTILMSTYYHEGTISKAHSKAYVDALIDDDSAAAKKALTAKTKNSNKLIAARGKEELDYFNSSAPPETGKPGGLP